MAKSKEAEIAGSDGLAISMSVENWQFLSRVILPEYPEIGREIIRQLQDSLEDYSGLGPTVGLSFDEWEKVLALVEDQPGSETLVFEVIFKLVP